MAASVPPSSALPPLLFASALSAYGLFLCKENITRLQQYEAQSEKAAEWSNTAAQRLHKTRTTQTSGTLSVRPPLLPTPYTLLRPPH
jgi:7-keto-8-aminopelargonate synthetase-like enzyme